METLKERRAWGEVFWALNENNFKPRILYPAKLSFKVEEAIKVTKPPLQNILQGILHTKMKANKTMKGQTVPNHRRRNDKKVESNIDSAAHNQTLKQQRQLTDRNHRILINTNNEC
jgi:hypothetical protein